MSYVYAATPWYMIYTTRQLSLPRVIKFIALGVHYEYH